MRLRKPLEGHLRAGHPWIYADALEPLAGAARPRTGDEVLVEDRSGRPLARGRYDADAPIAVRVWSLDPALPLDDDLVARRVASALALRRSLGLGQAPLDGVRLLNGEGDFLPGLVADRYAGVVVLKLDGQSAAPAVPAAVRALAGTSIILRERGGGGEPELLAGAPPPDEVIIEEHGARYPVDVRRGQKTGFFLDQRDNRRLVAEHAAGADLLNLFSYSGGFSIAAALCGARRTTSVDQAEPAVRAAARALALNGLDPRAHGLVRADVFAYLEELAGGAPGGGGHPGAGRTGRAPARQFDVVVCDPPSFAPSERALGRALRAYAELNCLAARVVAPGGLLFTASCSSHVSTEAFVGAVRDGLARTGRPARLLQVRGQPADHPTPPAFAEGRYLKLLMLRLD